MLQKIKILDRLTSGVYRFFKTSLFSRQIHNLAQFHSGGEDFNPAPDAEGLGGSIGENPANGIVFSWRDNVERKSAPGEKRFYAVNPETPNKEIAEIWLKNTGVIEINGGSDLNIVVNGNCNLKAAAVNIDAPVTNIGVGGAQIARLGDEVTVDVTSGSSAGTYKGTITSAGVNTSI